jgi:small subunit ribosomal protein S16
LAVKIRLQRIGMPKQPSYRVVVCDAQKPRGGAVLENLGHYVPYKPEKPLDIDMDAYRNWISKGAQPTDSVKKLVKILRKRGRTEITGGGKGTATEAVVEPALVETAPAEGSTREPETDTSTEDTV